MARRFVQYTQLAPEFGIPYTRQWIDKLCSAGKFPPKRRLSEHRVGWFSDEIEAYLASLAVAA